MENVIAKLTDNMATGATPLAETLKPVEPAPVKPDITKPNPAKPDLAKPSEVNPVKWYKQSKFKIIVAIILLVCMIAYFARNAILGTPIDVQYATTGELTQTVVASGRILTPQRISIATEAIGRVTVIPVIEGQVVKRGQLLLQLNDADERADVANANAALLQANAKLRQLREVVLPTANQSLNQVNSNVEQLRRQLARTAELQRKGFYSQAQLDIAKRDFEVANSQASAARLQVQTNQTSGSDLALANAAIAQANASLKLAQVKLQENAILAPADGTLISRDVEEGDIVQPGKELMMLAGNGQTQIAVLLDEKNIAKIAINQPALASADAFADQRFNAVVSYINPGIDATRGSVEIKLRVDNPPAYLRQDMTVSVDIITAHRTNALMIPSATLHDASTNAPWVMVVRNKLAMRQTVKLGLRGDNQLEVLSGLKSGEALLLASIGTIRPNQRVRIIKNKASK
jgi:HlyD family secretion protein